MLLYHLESSNSLHTVPCTLASGSFDQLKLFNGFAGCGTFFFAKSGFGGAGAVFVVKILLQKKKSMLTIRLPAICIDKGGHPGAGGGNGGMIAPFCKTD